MANATEGIIDKQCVKEIEADKVPSSQASERLAAIDRAKGLGIALVVWGHLATSATLGLPTWFYISVTAIYSFHMPLFMYLSGFVFFLSKNHEKFWDAPIRYSWKRFDRLIIPCLFFAIAIILGKYFVQAKDPFHSFEYFTHTINDGFAKTFENARDNPALSLWYLIVLFVYSIAVPIVSRFLAFPAISLCIIGIVIWSFEFPEKYYIERIAQYFIFFAVGGVFATYRKRILPMLSAYYFPALILFALCCFLTLGSEWALLISGLASIPALHGLFIQKFWGADRLFLFLGNNSMAIYLLNTIAIGIGQIVYTRYLPYQGIWFFLYLPIALLFGLLAPIAIRYALSTNQRLQVIKRYID